MKYIELDFGNIAEELKNKKLKLGFVSNGHFLEDGNGNIYTMEIKYWGGHIDKFISNNNRILFEKQNKSAYMIDFDKLDKWDYLKMQDFIKKHHLQAD